MSTVRWCHLAVTLAAAATIALPLGAQTQRAVQVSLVTPVQIFPESDPIGGVRLNVIYGRNVSVAGFDVGIVNHTTTGVTKGYQLGIVGIADNRFVGWQHNWVNFSKISFEGFQSGVVNVAGDASGFQLGGVNVTDYTHGLQISLVNYTKSMKGLQIGVINIIKEGGFLPVFPIVNWSFD